MNNVIISEESLKNYLNECDNDLSKCCFFKCEGYYACFGNAACLLATQFYHTMSVLRIEHGLQKLCLNRKMFSCAVSLLLEKKLTVWLFYKRTARWELEVTASPGNVDGIVRELSGCNIETISSFAVMASIVSNGHDYGVSILSKDCGTLQLFEFQDNEEMKNLESLITQCNVRECLLIEDIRHEVLIAILKRNRVTINLQSSVIFEISTHAGSDKLEICSQLELLHQTYDTDTTVQWAHTCHMMSHMKLALAATSAILIELNMWRNCSYHGTFSIVIGDIQGNLKYDANTCNALTIFRNCNSNNNTKRLRTEAQRHTESHQGPDTDWYDPATACSPMISSRSSSSSGGGGGCDNNSRNCYRETSGDAEWSLLGILDNTRTVMGATLLRQWVLQPSCLVDIIRQRQACVTYFVSNVVLRCALRDDRLHLLGCPDIKKLGRKLIAKPIRATLWDLISIYRAVDRMVNIVSACSSSFGPNQCVDLSSTEQPRNDKHNGNGVVFMVEHMKENCAKLSSLQALIVELVDMDSLLQRGSSPHLSSTSSTAVPSSVQGVGVSDSESSSSSRFWGDRWIQVRPSYTAELTRLHSQMIQLRSDIRQQSSVVAGWAGVASKQVHVEQCATHGLHMRVTKKDSVLVLKQLNDKLKKADGVTVLSNQKAGTLFVTAQFLKLASRYKALKALYELAQADVLAQAMTVAATFAPVLLRAADELAQLDCICCLAHVSCLHGWTAPVLLPSPSKDLQIEGLRHACLSARIGSSCIPSNIDLSNGKHVAVITGPNMGGKSTFIRAVGLCVLLAHMGCYVPASRALVPVTDRLLVRMGASDNIASGQSTFMTEMTDLAGITHTATAQSLVLIDELGRGTSTADGCGIVWASVDRLARVNRSMVLIATHFHEVTAIAACLSNVQNLHVSALVSQDSCSKQNTSNYSNNTCAAMSCSSSTQATGGGVTMLYQICEGPSNKSFGIEIAKLACFPSTVIDEAHKIVEQLEQQPMSPQES